MAEEEQTTAPGPGPRSARDIALDMFRSYGRGFTRMLAAAALVMVPLLLAGPAAFGTDFVSLIVGTPGSEPPPLSDAALAGIAAYGGLYLLGMLAVSGAVAELSARGLAGSDLSIGRAYGVTIRRLPSMLGAALITALTAGLPLALAASMTMSFLTIADVILLALTVALAVYLGVRLAFTVFAALLERAGMVEAVARSWRLVSEAWRRTFALLVLVSLLVGIIQIALEFAGAASPTAAAIISAVVVTPLTVIGNLLIYLDLRARKEGYSTGALAKELDALASPDSSPT